MTAVAAQSMAWQRRMRNHPGPLGALTAPTGGSGEQPTGLPQVELYIGGWIDVTALGLVRHQQGIHITRGQPDETQQTNAATASFRLANLDGRFTPTNPSGPYYGKFDRNTPCRISVPSGNTKSYRFWGEISSWPADWDPTGNDAWVDVQAGGILRRLGIGSNPLQSVMRRNLTTLAQTQPIAYWPCEDGSNATSIASGISSGTPMTFTGSPTLSSSSAFAVSQALPVLNKSVWTGRVGFYADSGSIYVQMLVFVPSTGAPDGAVLVRLFTSGSASRYDLVYNTANSGSLTMNSYDSNGTLLSNSGEIGVGMNGAPAYVEMDMEQVGSQVQYNLGYAAIGSQTGFGVGGNSNGQTLGRLTTVIINPGGTINDTVVGQVYCSNVVQQLTFGADPHLTGYNGETAGARVQRLCGEQGITFDTTYSGYSSAAMGPQTVDTLTNLLLACADADGGILYETTTALGLGYRPTSALVNQAPVATLDYPSSQLADVPKAIHDDTYTRNDITVTRLNGSSLIVQQKTGPLNYQAPPAGVGDYNTSVTLNLEADTQLPDQAGWRLHLGTVADARYPAIGTQLSRSEVTSSPTLRQQILGVQPGDRIVVTNPPVAWLPPDPISQLAIGWQETFDQFLHHVQWNGRPESAFRVAVLDDTTFGHADTDGSTLAAPATATAATLSVATTSSTSPTWTTKQSDYPFDLSVGGERVTAVSPSTNLSTDPLMAAGLTNWTAASATASVDGTYQYVSGQNPIMLVPNAGAASGGLISVASTGAGTVTPASVYRLGCWVYCPQGWTDVRAAVDWYDVNGVFLSSGLGSASTIPAAAWTFLTQDLTAPASASQAFPRFRFGSTPGPGVLFWVWAVTMVPVASISAVSPQTLSVIRSVNGVVRAAAQGTAVQLWQPAILTM